MPLLSFLICCCLFWHIPNIQAEKLPIKVVATFSILADLVQEVGGERIHIDCIVGANSDPHIYEPKPSDLKKLENAHAIFINGLGFEGWLERLLETAEYKGKVVVATDHIHPRLVFEGTMVQDPHAWHSIPNAKIYVINIRDKLIEIDPDGRVYYKKNAENLLKKLTDLDVEIRQKIDVIAPTKRKVITAHDAFGYFGNAYGIQFMAPQGISTESEARVQNVVHLINQIKDLNVKTIFIENISDPKLIEQISKETGAKIGGILYSDALSDPKGPAGNYSDMMRYNVDLLLQSMREL